MTNLRGDYRTIHMCIVLRSCLRSLMNIEVSIADLKKIIFQPNKFKMTALIDQELIDQQ